VVPGRRGLTGAAVQQAVKSEPELGLASVRPATVMEFPVRGRAVPRRAVPVVSLVFNVDGRSKMLYFV